MELHLAPTAGGLELSIPAKSPAHCLVKVNPYITREAKEASG